MLTLTHFPGCLPAFGVANILRLSFNASDYATNRALGKWVAKQREQHRALKRGEHSFLTPDRLEQLNSVGFVWPMKGRTPKEDEAAAMEDAAVAAAKAAVAAAVEAQDAEADKQEQARRCSCGLSRSCHGRDGSSR